MYVLQQGGATLVPAGMLANGQPLYTVAGPNGSTTTTKSLAGISLPTGSGNQFMATTAAGLSQGPILQTVQGQQRYVQMGGPNELQVLRLPAHNQSQVIQGVVQPGRQLASLQAGRTLVPVQMASNAVQQTVRPTGGIPSKAAILHPAINGAMYTQQSVMPVGVRPPVARMPRMGTVQTYNPSTGTLVQPPTAASVGNGPAIQQPVAIHGQIPLGMSAGGVPVHVANARPRTDLGGRVVQATTGATGMQQAQLVAQLGGRTVAMQQGRPLLVNSNGTPVNVVRLAQNNVPNGSVPLMDHALVARLLETQAQQPRNTVLAVPVANTHNILQQQQQQQRQMISLDNAMLKLNHYQALPMGSGQMQLAQDQGVKRPVSVPAMLPCRASHDSFLLDAGFMGRPGDGFHQVSLSTDNSSLSSINSSDGPPSAGISLTRGISCPTNPTATFPSMVDAVQQGRVVQGAGVGGGAPYDSTPNGEDVHSILASIGVELARYGIPVDVAADAGWLGVLGPQDLVVLQEAYLEEEARMLVEAQQQLKSAPGPTSNEDGRSNPSPAASVVSSQAGQAGGLTQEQLLQGTGAMVPAGGMGFTFGMLASEQGAVNGRNRPEQDRLGRVASLDVSMLTGGAQAEVKLRNMSQASSDGASIDRSSSNAANHTPMHAGNSNAAGMHTTSHNGSLADRFTNLDLGCGFF